MQETFIDEVLSCIPTGYVSTADAIANGEYLATIAATVDYLADEPAGAEERLVALKLKQTSAWSIRTLAGQVAVFVVFSDGFERRVDETVTVQDAASMTWVLCSSNLSIVDDRCDQPECYSAA